MSVDGNESDVEVAELEEQEALAIQQRMAQQLEEADFGLDFITHLKVIVKIFYIGNTITFLNNYRQLIK